MQNCKKTENFPDVVLLDLNMPKKSGHEVLSFMKDDDKLKVLPVILLTVSENSHDVETALSLKMNYYLHKPVTTGVLEPLLRAIVQLWKHNSFSFDTNDFQGFSSKTDLIQYVLAGNPNTPAYVLKELSGHPRSKIRAHVATNAKTPLQSLSKLASDPNSIVRRSLAFNEQTPLSIFEKLIKDKDLDVVMGVASSLYTPSIILRTLTTHENSYVSFKAGETIKHFLEHSNTSTN